MLVISASDSPVSQYTHKSIDLEAFLPFQLKSVGKSGLNFPTVDLTQLLHLLDAVYIGYKCDVHVFEMGGGWWW